MRRTRARFARLVGAGAVALSICVPVTPLLAQTWRELSPTERYEALQNYQRHEKLPADRQRAIEQRYERWRTLPPEERARVRQNYERLQKLPPQERERFEKKYEKWRRHGVPSP